MKTTLPMRMKFFSFGKAPFFRSISYRTGFISEYSPPKRGVILHFGYIQFPDGKGRDKCISIPRHPCLFNSLSTSTFLGLIPLQQTGPWFHILAYLVLIGLLTTLFIRLYRFQLNRSIERKETKKAKELNELKARFYAKVTQEFQSPLSAILGYAEHSINHQNEYSKEELVEKMKAVENNSRKMIHLVNQVLDFRKLDANDSHIEWELDDIVPLVRYIVEGYQVWAKKKNIQLSIVDAVNTLVMDFDRDKLHKILTNLLSNALKFTPENGKVIIQLKQKKNHLLIIVKDTGPGIPAHQLSLILDRLHHLTENVSETDSSLRLALVKELTELMGGQLIVQSITNVGSSFTVRLPIHREALPVQQPAYSDQNFSENIQLNEEKSLSKAETVSGDDRPIILIVEDNQDAAIYLDSVLNQKYRTYFAANGKQGLEKTLEMMPDLVVTDLIMPEMDGYGLLNAIKNNERTSHIPVIILTGKSDMEDRVEGLRRGADYYLAKPFMEDELLVLVEKSLIFYEKMEKRYAQFYFNQQQLQKDDSDFGSYNEDAFCKKVLEKVLANYGASEFNVVALCREMQMSYAQLHRKLSTLTGKSPNQIIREVRLQKAKILLENPELNIGDIAALAGFTDPSYFTRVFAREYGMPPTEYREKNILSHPV